MRKEISAFSGLEEWLVANMGRELESGVFETAKDAHDEPLLAYRIGEVVMMRVIEDWGGEVKRVVAELSDDELFSILGAYELARVTLPHDSIVWGPSLYYFGDADTFRPAEHEIAAQLSNEEVAQAANPKVFWHCDWARSVANFGVLDGDSLVALTTVWHRGGAVYEIGVDVAPGSGLRGLGRAVMSGACRWILDHGGLILASSVQWNIPSVRLLRSMGLRYVLSELHGMPGPFRCRPSRWGNRFPTHKFTICTRTGLRTRISSGSRNRSNEELSSARLDLTYPLQRPAARWLP